MKIKKLNLIIFIVSIITAYISINYRFSFDYFLALISGFGIGYSIINTALKL